MISENEKHILWNEDFPLSSKYDAQWVLDNQMGPNALWLTEWLCRKMELRPGMRILDLGCGRALSSIFLAREFDVEVHAADLWVKAAENLKRIRAAGLGKDVFPVDADARQLPFEVSSFDAVLCVDAYIYFGTDDLYLNYLHRFVKPGGQIGIVVPGFMQDIDECLPEHLEPFWAQECWTWHTVPWWDWHWRRTGLVDVEVADAMPDGWRLWLKWYDARRASGDVSESLASDIKVVEADQGRYMGFVRMIGRRPIDEEGGDNHGA